MNKQRLGKARAVAQSETVCPPLVSSEGLQALIRIKASSLGRKFQFLANLNEIRIAKLVGL